MKKFKVVTLGCRTNQYESQGFSDQLAQMGYQKAEAGEEADLCIVNTCTVTESADSASRHEIRSLLRKNPKAKIAVTGCMVESAPDVIEEIFSEQPVQKNDSRLKIVANQKKENLIQELFPDVEDLPEFQIKTFDAHTRAFVKVQDGCNSFCTYCVIPYVRGRSRSRPIEDIVAEIKGLIAKGYKEVVITGINVGDFDGGGNLAHLVRTIDQIEGLERLRISSIDPDEVDDDLADAVLNGKTTAPSMHIVLQSGSNVILKRMNRKYTKQMFLDTVRRMKKINPDFTVTTDVIVGFPGETEADFADTVEIAEEVQFAKIHMFPYSARKRTRAALYPNQIAPDVMKIRKQKLLRLSEQMAFQLREKFLGREMLVLLEGEEKEGMISGHTPNFLRVWIPKQSHKANEIVNCLLETNGSDGFMGRVI